MTSGDILGTFSVLIQYILQEEAMDRNVGSPFFVRLDDSFPAGENLLSFHHFLHGGWHVSQLFRLTPRWKGQ